MVDAAAIAVGVLEVVAAVETEVEEVAVEEVVKVVVVEEAEAEDLLSVG